MNEIIKELEDSGIEVSPRNKGHLVLSKLGKAVDFWHTKNKWSVRGENKIRHGKLNQVVSFFDDIQNERDNAVYTPFVTIFSDACVLIEKNSAGWGAWIKGDSRNSITANGRFKQFSRNTALAELQAIACAIHTASVSGYFRKSDRAVMVQSDSHSALGILLGSFASAKVSNHRDSIPFPVSRTRDVYLPVIENIRSNLARHGLSLILRHVKGHSSGNGRNYINELCDRLAKQAAKAQLREESMHAHEDEYRDLKDYESDAVEM